MTNHECHIVQRSLHSEYPQRLSNADLSTTENSWSDMVANKIKYTTAPAELHGHIWH